MSKNSDTWNICFRPNNIHAHHPRFYICYQVFIDDVEKCWQGFSVVIPHFHPDAARFFSLSPFASPSFVYLWAQNETENWVAEN